MSTDPLYEGTFVEDHASITRRAGRTGWQRGAAWCLILVLAAMATLIALQAPSAASANGDSGEIARSRQGRYELVIGIQPETPRVGTVHFSFVALDAATSRPVTDAVIVVVANDENGVPTYETRAVNAPDAPEYYDANLTFEVAGKWTLAVSVRSPQLGEAKFGIPFVILEDSDGPGAEGTLVLLALVAVLTGGAAYVWHSARRRRIAAGL